MAVTILTGQVNDQTILANERVVDMEPLIDMLDPDETQFTTMMKKIGSKPAYSSLVEWLEDEWKCSYKIRLYAGISENPILRYA